MRIKDNKDKTNGLFAVTGRYNGNWIAVVSKWPLSYITLVPNPTIYASEELLMADLNRVKPPFKHFQKGVRVDEAS